MIRRTDPMIHRSTGDTVTIFFDHCLISLFYIKPQPASRLRSGDEHCLISLFYIKPQHISQIRLVPVHCLISLFYIKPQPTPKTSPFSSIVLYLFSTSNHNDDSRIMEGGRLSYISFLHQTTTPKLRWCWLCHCLISLFYIKPQLFAFSSAQYPIVLYLFSTSNHNLVNTVRPLPLLSYISFLHQTTTVISFPIILVVLSYISFLHQTTTGCPSYV